MPSSVSLNNLLATLSAPSGVVPYLSPLYWGENASTAPGGTTTKLLWMDRDEGITDHKTWVFTTSLTVQGVSVSLQESLTGTDLSSDLLIQIAAGPQSTGWQSGNTSLRFTGTQGTKYLVEGQFVSGGIYDDVIYTLKEV
ncbi:hypothetical protein JY651_02985 [Pyxidicoccus parkwayensis]|uniref:Uncharacterized protein n=1 Tax=Pyxidicoccus parkwayensis TaxID=2813578 RepID=A0ABX7P2J3_9BACT|nr:hypothetical protein [Pyxidicoccus parkwaysis]QSQ23963.1 hypothetical protein JY651_02985 [Pyxidicoccus parkwaysis]